MDTPIIAQYYRETEPEKRKELLDRQLHPEKIRKQIRSVKKSGSTLQRNDKRRGHCRRLSEILDGIGI